MIFLQNLFFIMELQSIPRIFEILKEQLEVYEKKR